MPVHGNFIPEMWADVAIDTFKKSSLISGQWDKEGDDPINFVLMTVPHEEWNRLRALCRIAGVTVRGVSGIIGVAGLESIIVRGRGGTTIYKNDEYRATIEWFEEVIIKHGVVKCQSSE